ncbi:ShlB/FhaC/HecB family hemolysin secretion/activation protein [Burkholderia sp. BCC1988]|uniref:ShlB/FhaC/HecB family hemolysin secretion/activation protein n=1 Tax=Burkholderia sp. BCC1988 TaxID=2817443 RepID=UPI0039F031C0
MSAMASAEQPAEWQRLAGRLKRSASCQLRAVPVFALAWLAVSVSHAQSYRAVAPLPPPVTSQPPAPTLPIDRSIDVAVARLHGIAFVRADAVGQPDCSSSSSIDGAVRATELPLLTRPFLDRFSADIGHPLSFARLAEIRRAVVQAYRAAGRPLVDVYLPEQDVNSGDVTIAVAEFRVGQVTARGNRYFSSALLEREMRLHAGGTISEADIGAGLALLNANPYRRVDVVYAPGEGPGTTDVVLQTDDRLPLRVYAGYNNDGVPQLGRDRMLTGIDYGNLFGSDVRFGYQMTASNDLLSGTPDIGGHPNGPRFIAHAMSLVAPLPWLDSVELFGSFARSTPRLPDSYAQSGISAQISFRYDRRLPSVGAWQQQVQAGYDFKRSNNDLEFGGFQVFNANTHVHQFVFAYDATKHDTSGDTHLNVTLVASPGRLDRDNGADAFDASRLGATPRYQYLQLAMHRDLPLGASNFTWSTRAQAQWTGNTLLPSEEMSLGGDATVRGYEPYAAQGDRGWNVQTELRAPAFGVGIGSLEPFAFFDAGHVWNRIVQPTELNNVSLASIGAGVRFQADRFVSVRGTLGFPLRAVAPNGSRAPLAEIFVVFGS